MQSICDQHDVASSGNIAALCWPRRQSPGNQRGLFELVCQSGAGARYDRSFTRANALSGDNDLANMSRRLVKIKALARLHES
jgi:hypothetical protein